MMSMITDDGSRVHSLLDLDPTVNHTSEALLCLYILKVKITLSKGYFVLN